MIKVKIKILEILTKHWLVTPVQINTLVNYTHKLISKGVFKYVQ